MGDIAARSGIRKSSLFHHFPTKDELYRDAIGVVLAEIGARMTQEHNAPGTFLERQDRSTLQIQRYFGENAVAARLLIREFINGAARILPQGGELLDAVLQNGVDLLEDAMRTGEIPTQDARQLIMSMAGVHLLFYATPVVSERLLGKDVFAKEQVEERARTVCVHLRLLLGVKPG